jgi:uncharacterized protein
MHMARSGSATVRSSPDWSLAAGSGAAHMAGFEWDPRKEQSNLRKHHFDFTTATLIWGGPAVEKIDDRREYGETRIIAVGEAGGCIIVVVYTWRGEDRRIISARKANSREKSLFEEEIKRRRGSPPDRLGSR